MILKFETKLSRAGSHGDSTKTTVPKKIMELLDLKIGNKVVWTVETISKDEIVVCITPKE